MSVNTTCQTLKLTAILHLFSTEMI